MSSLSNEEKETLISFDETPAPATVFTYSQRWQRHLEQRMKIKPHMNNGFGGREYYVPKDRLKLPQPKVVLSPERREKLKEQLASARKTPHPAPKVA